jgi:F420-0:gamma-glutamyl ligase
MRARLDLAEAIVEAAEQEQVALEDGDIIIVGHKVVSARTL